MNNKRSSGTSTHKIEGNTYANQALTLALGLRKPDRPNWSCCHIWGIDDATYQSSNAVVQDRRFYSCVANMVLLPTPLKAFTDAMPDLKAMLRLCARNLYGWWCDHEAIFDVHHVLNNWSDWAAYPASWPRAHGDGKKPLGLVELSPEIEQSAVKRIARVWHDLEHAGPYYPRETVQDVLAYWKIRPARLQRYS